MLMTRVTPKISDRPARTRNSPEALASPLSAWNRTDWRVMAGLSSCREKPGRRSFRRTQLLYLGVRRQHRGAVDIFEVDHHRLAVLERELADIGAHGRLVVAAAIDERAEGALHLEAVEGLGDLRRVAGARLGNAGGERFHGDVADHRAEPRIVVELLLVGAKERL